MRPFPGVRVIAAVLLLGAATSGCNTPGRSVRAWIETREADGDIVAGATVTVDGRPLGLTDQRGLYRLKIRRRVGAEVSLLISDERDPARTWSGTFTVGTDGGPQGHPGGRIRVVVPEASR